MNTIAKSLAVAALGSLAMLGTYVPGPAQAAGKSAVEIKKQDWSFSGLFGQYDEAQLRRGWAVYQTACSSCHGLERVAFRSLAQPGGPNFNEEAVKKLASEWPNQITAGPNEDGEMFKRPPELSDPIKGPWANEAEGRLANGGAYPPDLSLITRARTFGTDAAWYLHVPEMAGHILTGYSEKGQDYIYNLLTGYPDETPEGVSVGEGLYYNPVYPGGQIAMPAPLYDEVVEYGEDAGAEATLSQHAKDVTAFLSWAADPHLNQRKSLGWQVMLYLVITTVLLYIGKQRLWARVKKKPAEAAA